MFHMCLKTVTLLHALPEILVFLKACCLCGFRLLRQAGVIHLKGGLKCSDVMPLDGAQTISVIRHVSLLRPL